MEKPYYPIRHHTTATMGDGPLRRNHERDALTDDNTVVTQVVFRPAKQSRTDGDRFNTTASTTSPTHSGKEHQLDGSIPKRGQRARRTNRPPNHRTAAWPASVPRQHPRPRSSLHGQERSRSACRGVAGMFRSTTTPLDRTGPRRYRCGIGREQACEPISTSTSPDGRPRVDRPPDDHDRRRTRRRRPSRTTRSRRRTSTGATPSVAIGFLLIRISTTTQQPDTVLAIDQLDKEGRIVFDRFFGRDDDQDAASNADAASTSQRR